MATKKPKIGKSYGNSGMKAKAAALRQKAGVGGKPSKGQWAKNSRDAAMRAKGKLNTEDAYIGRSKRIRDEGQKPPKGYMRTGGRYFAKIENMVPIRTKTSKQQRAFFYANKDKFLGADRKGGWMASVGRQGMYDGTKSLANFRKTTAARKSMDKAKTYGRAGKSRYIMAIGQDGHAR